MTAHPNARRWSTEQITERICRWQRENHGQLPTAEEWQVPGDWPNYKTLCRRFGSWSKAMTDLGFAGRGRGEFRLVYGRRPTITAKRIVAWQRWAAERTVHPIVEAQQKALLDPELYALVADQIRDSHADGSYPQILRGGIPHLPPGEVAFEYEGAEPSFDDWLIAVLDARAA